MKAYHRVDPLMDERKGHYTPAQLGAFLKVQLVAGRQSQRGRFRSMAVLRGILPAAYAKHLDFLVHEGDLVIRADESVYLDGWDEWQEGDLTVKDRMTALRNRRRNPSVTSTVTSAVTQPSPTATRSSVGVGVSVEEGADAPSSARDPVVVYANLTGSYPSPKAMDWIDELSGKFGDEAVIRTLGEASQRVTGGKVIGEAQNLLLREARELSKREKEAEAEKIADRRLNDMLARRLEFFRWTGEWKSEWGERPAA